MSSNREPMWYCHECGAEMRPLMVPDPHCASCHGSFVEMIENPSDNPRDFHQAPGGINDNLNAGPGDFLFDLFGGGGRVGGGSGFTLHINGPRGAEGARAFVLGRNAPGEGTTTDQVPSLSEFIRGGAGSSTGGDRTRAGGVNPQQAIIGHLLSALAQRQSDRQGGFNPFAEILAMNPPGIFGPEGRHGDYAYTQEALDQIITQLMETNTHRPVPATDDIIEKLQKEVLEYGSPLLEKECAVCKDQFNVNAEDPDEHIVITLPCKHPYHQSCIMPWLRSSGTCPVCRDQLVPQPGHEAPPGSPPPASSSGERSPPASTSPGGGGLMNGLFSYLGSGPSRRNSTGSGRGRSDSRSTGHRGPPGGWSDELD